MKTFAVSLTILGMAFGPSIHAEGQAPFVVQDIAEPTPILGQLGEPGAPSLNEQQAKLAKALLDRGLCNVTFYGAEFCARQKTRAFKVTDEIGSSISDHNVIVEDEETF
jgi:hypothetical protein